MHCSTRSAVQPFGNFSPDAATIAALEAGSETDAATIAATLEADTYATPFAALEAEVDADAATIAATLEADTDAGDVTTIEASLEAEADAGAATIAALQVDAEEADAVTIVAVRERGKLSSSLLPSLISPVLLAFFRFGFDWEAEDEE